MRVASPASACAVLHTAPAGWPKHGPASHGLLCGLQAGGDPWDTVKPLSRWFTHLHRVLLFDDDAYKVGELVELQHLLKNAILLLLLYHC
jgi:hypothetical protein